MEKTRPVALFLESGKEATNTRLLKIASRLQKCGCNELRVVLCPPSMAENYDLPFISDEHGGPMYGEAAIRQFLRFKMEEKSRKAKTA